MNINGVSNSSSMNEIYKLQKQTFAERQIASVADDVTKSGNTTAIDKAINSVSTQRGEAGAKYNGMLRTMSANAIAKENVSTERRGIEDADIAKIVMDFKKSQTANKPVTFAQRQTQSTTNANAGRYIDMLV